MRIGFISSYPPIECGIGTYTKYLDDALRQYENETFVISQFGAQGPRVFPIFGQEESGFAAKVFNVSSRMTPDVVHIQHEYGLYGAQKGVEIIELILRYNLVGCPVVTTLHTVNPDNDETERKILKNVIAESAAVIVHETNQKDVLVRLYGQESKIHVIEHGIRELDLVKDAKEKLGVTGKKVVLICGYFRPTKALHKIVEIFPDVCRNDENIVLIIAGKSRGLEFLEYQKYFYELINNSPAKKNIRVFRGQFPQHTFDTIISAADCIVLPYEKGAQSGMMCQCFAFHKPVVASSLPAFKKAIERTGGGLIAESDADYATKILSILDDENLGLRIKTSIKDYISEKAGWSLIARKHIDVYRSVIRVPYGDARYIYFPSDAD